MNYEVVNVSKERCKFCGVYPGQFHHPECPVFDQEKHGSFSGSCQSSYGQRDPSLLLNQKSRFPLPQSGGMEG